MKPFVDFGMSMDSKRILDKMQEQSSDWIMTATQITGCRDLGSVVRLQTEFSKRMMDRWFSVGGTAPAKPQSPANPPATKSPTKAPAPAKPAASAAPAPVAKPSSTGKNGSTTTISYPPKAKAPATPKKAKPSVAKDDLEVVTAIKDHKAASKAVKPTKAAAAPAAELDDLTALKGIGPAMARKLESIGIKTLADVVAMTPAKIDEVESVIGFKGRVTRDDWQGQAKALIG